MLKLIVLLALMSSSFAAAWGAESDYSPVVGPRGESRNFKELNKPSALVPGGLANTLQVVYVAGSSSPDKLKFFVPPGTIMMTANFLAYLNSSEAKGVMKLNTPPATELARVTRDMAFSQGNSGGSSFGGAFDQTILQNILLGREVFFYGDAGAGLMPISYGGTPISRPDAGGWVYGAFQYPGGILGSMQWNIYVDRACYESWYARASWDGDGNPAEGVAHTCSGSSPLAPTSPSIALTGISLSRSQLNPGVSGAEELTITPQPSNASLPQCTANPANLVSIGAAAANGGVARVSLTNEGRAVVSTTEVAINCGAYSQRVSIVPRVQQSTVTAIESVDSSGNTVLSVSLKRGESELTPNANGRYWVVAVIPLNIGGVVKETLLFLGEERGWQQLSSLDLVSVAFRKNVRVQAEERVDIPLGFSREALAPFKVKIYFAYQIGNGELKVAGEIFDSTR